MFSMAIRLLGESDAVAYQALRLQSLKEHPEAFGAAYEEEVDIPIADVGKRLVGTLPDNATFGAFDDTLIGIVNVIRFPGLKTQHRAIISAMYVLPEARRSGAGRALLNEALAYARAMPNLEEVILAVTVGNEAARNLYIAGGFVPYSIVPRYLKVGAQYYDIEWMSLRL